MVIMYPILSVGDTLYLLIRNLLILFLLDWHGEPGTQRTIVAQKHMLSWCIRGGEIGKRRIEICRLMMMIKRKRRSTIP